MLNFLLRCWVCNWVVFGSWTRMRSSTEKGLNSCSKFCSENGFRYSEESPWKAPWKVKNLIWALAWRRSLLNRPAGKTEANSWQEAMQKRISGDSRTCCNSILTIWLFVELQTVFQVEGLSWLLRLMFHVTEITEFHAVFFSVKGMILFC